MRSLFVVTAVVACLTGSSALACTVPPPGSSAEQARLRLAEQTAQLNQATTVFLAEIVRADAIPVEGGPMSGRRIVLRPLYALKGSLPAGSLTLRHEDQSNCGLFPRWDALWGEPGQTFVIFSGAATPRQAAVIASVRTDLLVQPDLRARLARRPAP